MRNNLLKKIISEVFDCCFIKRNIIKQGALLIVLIQAIETQGQAPGGVSTNLKSWFKADQGLNNVNGASIGSWGNIDNTFTLTQATGSQQPIFYSTTASNLVNFNPALSFDNGDELFTFNRLFSNTAPFSLIGIGVDRRTNIGDLDGIMGMGADGNFPGLDFQTDGVSPNGWNPYSGIDGEWTGGTATLYSLGAGATNLASNIVGLTSNNIVGGNDNIISYVNGTKQSTTISANQNIQFGNGLWIGSSGDAEYTGLIPEIIIYDKQLTDLEMQKVYSYLGIKYGVKLTHNYLASNGIVVYDVSSYNSNIIGIGRDDASGLNQKQSKSSAVGGLITIGKSTIESTNAANLATFSADRDYLVLGDDNGALTFSASGAPTNFQIIGRKWKVQETGTDATNYFIQVPSSISTASTKLPPLPYSTAYILQDADGNFSAGSIRIPLVVSGTNFIASNLDLDNGQFFTFASGPSVLEQIGTEADTATPSVVTVAQLATISPAITGLNPANEAAYQAYIDANPGAFSTPATAAEVQAMVNTVNAQVISNSVLAQIGTEADTAAPSVVTIAQLNSILPSLTGVNPANEVAYQAYIDANPNAFSVPATQAEVQAMINAVNASQSVLAQIGTEADTATPSVVTVAQLATISPAITGLNPANEAAYQAYIDANPGAFSTPATAAEVQAMVNTVNAQVISNSVLAQIGTEADTAAPSVVTIAQLNSILPGLTGVNPANEVAYQAYIDANPNAFSVPATQAEVQAMINAVNASQSVLAQIGTEADTATPSVVTVAQLATISPAITGLNPANEAAYQAYIDANPGAFSTPARAAEVQAMVNTVNAQVISNSVLAQIGTEADTAAPSVVTIAQLNSILPSLTGVNPANEVAYQAYIDANPNAFSVPATQAEVQAMINAVNASQSVLAQIGTEADTATPSVVTVAQLATISPAITGLNPANEAAYQAYIDANPGAFSTPTTAAEVQAMVNAVNATLGETEIEKQFFEFYPNPVEDILYLKASKSISKLLIYEITGREIISFENLIDGFRIDLSNLKGNVYLLSVEIEGKRKIVKLIKK